jgi:HlyD family secretion protein
MPYKTTIKCLVKWVITTIFIVSLQACNTESRSLEKEQSLNTSKQVISASGELESKTTAVMGPPSVKHMWQYQIKQLIPENTKVKKGDVIAVFDSKNIFERLVDKQAELENTIKKLENKNLIEANNNKKFILDVAEKQMQFEKAKRKFEIVDNSRSDNDRLKAQIDHTIAENDLFLAQKKLDFHHKNTLLNVNLAKARIDRFTNQVNDIKTDIEKLTLTAPIDGMVIYQERWDGEKPAVGESINFGQTILQLAVIEDMQLKAQIAEADSGKVYIGQKVKITLDGTPKLVTQGKVSALGRVFRNNTAQDRRRIIDVLIELDESDLDKNIENNAMRPGMTARIELQVKQGSSMAHD